MGDIIYLSCPHKASDALGISGCDVRGAAVFYKHQVELT